MIVIAGKPQEAVHAGGDDRQPLAGLKNFFIKGAIKSATLLARAVFGRVNSSSI